MTASTWRRVRPIHLADGRTVPALVYLADRAHRQFAGKLPLATARSSWCAGHRAPPAAISSMSGTPSPISASSGLRDRALEELARPRRAVVAAALAVGEDRLDDEAPLVTRLLDGEAEPLAQHDPALGRQRHAERVQRALAACRRQRRQLAPEPARKLLAVGGIDLRTMSAASDERRCRVSKKVHIGSSRS